MSAPEIERWTAFSDDPVGGNPAGVVVGAEGLDDDAMLAIAADIGFAETAFVFLAGDGLALRYFSPIAEVPFCGHATVAAAAALAGRRGAGELAFRTPVGLIDIDVTSGERGERRVAFTSADTEVAALDGPLLDQVLGVLGLTAGDLDPIHPPALAFGGNWHPLVVLREEAAFDDLAFDAVEARSLLDANGWPATLIVLWRERDDLWQARNIFPVGTLVEDPATGAAAAATGGYLRAIGAVDPPAEIVIEQGRHVGRPSELHVRIPERGGMIVSGGAVRIG